jgi:propionate CoA-transferase
VKEIELDGQKYLFYKALPIDVALVRGTTADPDGNVTMERESLYNDNMMQAMAGRARRGVVIAQVERVAAAGSLHPRHVRIPGTMVDCVVVAPAEKHPMSYWCDYNPAVTGDVREPPKPKGEKTMELDERKVVARRAVMEIVPDQVINLGIGMPEGVAKVAEEESILKFLELTTEPGVHGGIGVSGHNFGPAINSDALVEMHSQFDFYNGGGLDICFLGTAETDAAGNVNVTRAGPKLTGPGGFIDISQSTKRVNLLGAFTAGGLEVEVKEGALRIVKEGRIKKFVKAVKEVTFSGATATRNHQSVNYITERCVFTLTPGGIELIEVAPGVDLERDILAQMEFRPLIREPLRVMDPAIFRAGSMGLAKKALRINMEKRTHYCKATGNLYVDLSSVCVYSKEDVSTVEDGIRNAAAATVNAVVTYDNFDVAPRLMDDVAAAARRLEQGSYKSVRRVSSRALRRHKMHAALSLEQGMIDNELVDEQSAYDYGKRLGMMSSRSVFSTAFQQASSGGLLHRDLCHSLLRQVSL